MSGMGKLYYAVLSIIVVALCAGTAQASFEEDGYVLEEVLADLEARAAAQDAAGGIPRYDCERLFGDDIVLSLPIGDDEGEAVYITLHGKPLPAMFIRTGLDYRWLIDGESDYQIILGPDLVAGYFDFSGKKEGVQPDNNFYCKRVGAPF